MAALAGRPLTEAQQAEFDRMERRRAMRAAQSETDRAAEREERAAKANLRPTPLAQQMMDDTVVEQYRERAAVIAVDMERGLFVRTNPQSGQKEAWTGGYQRTAIGKQLGFKVHNGKLPKCLRSPEFERAVEWERIRRDAAYRVTLKEALPQLDVVMGGFLREAQRRVLSKRVEQIDDRVVFGELRRLIAMKAETEGATSPRGQGVHITINEFRAQIAQLPEEAQAIAIGLYKKQLERLSGAAKVIEGEFAETAAS
jgi:hypothetical protein